MATADGGTITYSVEIDSSGAVVGIKNAEKDMEAAAENAGTKSGNKLSKGWAVASGAIAGVTSQIFSKVTQIISSSVSSAIDRVDTLNRANTVFEALGYSTDAVNDSMGALKEYLKGLPTTLDGAVKEVQLLSASFGGIEQGTEYFMALNDAGLAFGATTEQVEGAITQLSQLSLDGPLDAQTWNSLRNNGFSPVFAAMANEAGITVGELKEQFGGEGTKTVQDFLDALIRLDRDGSGSMASLSALARENTTGIRTSFENMQAAINRGIESIVNAIGAENISNAITAIGNALETVGNTIAGIVNFIKENEVARDALLAFFITLGTLMAAVVVPAFVAWAVSLLTNPITWIILGVTALITGLILLVTHIEEVGQWFSDVFGAIGNFVGGVVEAIGNWFNDLFAGIGDGLRGIGEFFKNTFQSIWDFVTNIFRNIGNFFKGVWDTIVGVFTKVGTAVGDAVSGAFKAVVNGVLGFVEHFINTPMRLINNFIDVINGAFGAVGVNIGHVPTVSLPRMASGGIVESTVGGRIIMAGEGGEDEWVVPESKMASLIDQINGAGGGETINIYVDGVFATSAEERRKVASDIIDAYNQNQKRRFANA